MKRCEFVVAAALCLNFSGAATGDPSKPGELPSQLKLEDFPGVFIDEVIVPNPAELFTLMEKLGQPDWASRVRTDLALKKSTDRTELALLFGALIADGFIAVQAKNKTAVKDLGQEILNLSKALGLQESVLPHTQAIVEATDRGEWNRVREELDRTHKTVRDTMEETRDGELAQCVSIAGWVRGTEVLTGLIGEAYSTDKAEILNQPDLAAHFVKQIEAMEPKTTEKAPVQKILTGLREVRALMAEHQSEVLPSTDVARIHEICATILESIVKRES